MSIIELCVNHTLREAGEIDINFDHLLHSLGIYELLGYSSEFGELFFIITEYIL